MGVSGQVSPRKGHWSRDLNDGRLGEAGSRKEVPARQRGQQMLESCDRLEGCCGWSPT